VTLTRVFPNVGCRLQFAIFGFGTFAQDSRLGNFRSVFCGWTISFGNVGSGIVDSDLLLGHFLFRSLRVLCLGWDRLRGNLRLEPSSWDHLLGIHKLVTSDWELSHKKVLLGTFAGIFSLGALAC